MAKIVITIEDIDGGEVSLDLQNTPEPEAGAVATPAQMLVTQMMSLIQFKKPDIAQPL